MAKLYGLHRSTLYEAIEKGRVTVGFNGKGQRVIDLSEMIRRYGEPPGQARQNPTLSPGTNQTPADSELLARFDALLEVVKEQRDELRALREEVHQMRLLPAPKVDEVNRMDKTPETPQEPRQAEPPPDDTRNELRSLVAALRQSEG